MIVEQCEHVVVRDRIGWCIRRQPAGLDRVRQNPLSRPPIESAGVRADPQPSFRILVDGTHDVVGQSVFRAKRAKPSILPEADAAAVRADPQRAVFRLVQRADQVALETGARSDREKAPVLVPIEAGTIRPDPQPATAIRQQRVDVVVLKLALIEQREAYTVEAHEPPGRSKPEVPVRRLRDCLDSVLRQAFFGLPHVAQIAGQSLRIILSRRGPDGEEERDAEQGPSPHFDTSAAAVRRQYRRTLTSRAALLDTGFSALWGASCPRQGSPSPTHPGSPQHEPSSGLK